MRGGAPGAAYGSRGVARGRLDGEDAWAWLGEVKEIFLKPGRVPLEDVVLRKALTKHPKDYANDTPHVMVAKAMQRRGVDVFEGTKVPFVMTKRGAVYPTDLGDMSELDLGLIWNQYVYAPSKRVLTSAYPDFNWGAFDVRRGVDPNQLTMFDGTVPMKKASALSVRLPGHRVLKAGKVPPETRPIVMQVSNNYRDAEAARLKAILQAWPGEYSVVLYIRTEGRVVEVSVPYKVQVPAKDFDRALRQVRVICTDESVTRAACTDGRL